MGPGVEIRSTDTLTAEEATAISQRSQDVLLEAIRRDRRRRLDLDVRGLLALIVLLGSIGLAVGQLALTRSAELPSWLTGIAGSVIGFYFGARGGTDPTTNGHGK